MKCKILHISVQGYNYMLPERLFYELKKINLNDINIVLISTTAKNNNENRLLPPHKINGKECLNIILNDKEIAEKVLAYLDDCSRYFFIDVERKQKINLWEISQRVIKKSIILPYKPNDVAREAAYFLILQYFNYQISKKNILIYGTGNIAAKLALYLAEHEVYVSFSGRNLEKLNLLKDSLNSILPVHTSTPICLYSESKKYDVLITALSAENNIVENQISQLNGNALVIDIGINNLTPNFIKEAQKKSIQIYRLDVRIGSPMLEAVLSIYLTSFLSNNIGYTTFKGISCVAGGAIGEKGALILDNISHPKRIIGVANGFGGVKKYEEYTKTDLHNIEEIAELLQ